MAKRGLLVSYYFPPTGGGGVQRWVKYLKYLSGFDWKFSIITNDHSQANPKDATLLDEIPENSKIIRTKTRGTVDSIRNKSPFFRKSGYWQRWLSALFRITDSRLSWNKIAGKYLRDELADNQYDVIIITSPPYSLALLASEIKQLTNCPVVLDLRDPWTINPYKIYPTNIHRVLDEHREKTSVSKLKYIISAYKSTIDNYQNRIQHFDSKEILILPNGYDESDFEGLIAIDSFKGGDYNIGFSGSIYSHLNTPDPVFRAMSKIIKEGIDIHFHHVGTSVFNLSELAKKYDIEKNIHIWGYTDHKLSLRILQMMDVLCLILDDRWPQSENTIGGKFYEYLRLKKPIFAIVPEEGEAARAIIETNSGVIVSAKDNEKVAHKLKTLISNKQEFTWKGIEEFNRKHQAEVLNKFLEKIISS